MKLISRRYVADTRLFDRALAGLLSLCCVALLPGVASALESPSDPGQERVLADDADVDPQLLQQRQDFSDALQALADGDLSRFADLKASLSDYPLHRYLEYQQLRQQWRDQVPGDAQIDQLNAFEQRTGDTSLARRLTATLQSRLADTGQWRSFMALTESRFASAKPCEMLKARHETGVLDGFDEAALALWVQPRRHREPCRSILSTLEQRHTPPVPAIWERIYRAQESNKPEFARPMLGYLASADRALVKAWIDATDKPRGFLLGGRLDRDTQLNRRIIADVLLDWSREDTEAAMSHWLAVRDRYRFSSDRRHDTSRALAMRAAYRRMPQAHDWLYTFTARADDLELQEWRVRTALLAEDWQAVMKSIAELPAAEQAEDHWAYWQARALEQQGNSEQARAIYARLADLQSYHGFLSADRLQQPYAIRDESIQVDEALMQRLTGEPALVRAREFHAVAMSSEGRREWNNWLSGREESEMAASAVLASRWGLHDRAIYAAGRTAHRRAISIRFPLLYRSEVARASVEYAIDPAWIFGVMRRESAYIRDVRSSAGAVGLMQLMPRTARYVAGLQGNKDWRGDLTESATNIGFGTFYLRHVMNQFDDHQVLTTAGYNAGPHRVSQWLREGSMDADIWIDTIPFTETRRYVRAVLAYAAIYEYQLNGEPRRLADKLRPVPAASGA